VNIDWRGWTRGQWGLRALMVLGPLVAIFARWGSLGAPRPWLVGLVLMLAVGWALAPESVVGAVTLLVVGFSWASSEVTEVPWMALAAALGMLVAHLAALVASYGPRRLPVAPSVARLWAIRGAVVFAAAPLVWLLTTAVRDLPGSGTVWVAGLVVALSVVLVAAVATQSAMPQGDE
jgi:hypothetical protein